MNMKMLTGFPRTEISAHTRECVLRTSRNSSTGFTLVETLIAIAILTIAVAGPLYIADRAVVSAEIARDRLTASYLAQEGIEYVRAMRDNEFLAAYHVAPGTASDVAWANFLTGTMPLHPGAITSCRFPLICKLDPFAPVKMGFGSGFALDTYTAPAPLSLTNCTNGPNGLSCAAPNKYTQQSVGNLQTAFTRTIQAIDPIDVTAQEETIVSTVSWNFHGTIYTVTTTDHLTPWQ